MSSDSCAAVVSPDLLRVCVLLQNEIGKSGVDPLVTALIGVGAALMTALLTSISAHNLKRIERRNVAQRTALIEVQDAADVLRGRWTAHLRYVQSLTNPAGASGSENPFPDLEQTRLSGNLQTLLSRVHTVAVRNSYEAWSVYAQQYYSGSDTFQSFDEESKWIGAVAASGDKLRHLDTPQKRWWNPATWLQGR